MAAYAAVTSLKYTVDQIQHHPSPPISLDQHQAQSLTQIITLSQKFLELYISPFADSDEADPLELRIADAAYAAEDVIESYLVDNIHLVEDLSCIHFYQDLEKAIEEMDLVNREATEILNACAGSRSPLRSKVLSGNASAGSGEGKSEMVGFDDVLLQLLDKLTRGGRSNRQIIPIVGMGGIGKTTLARNIFENTLIKGHFDICMWATISQNYNIRETFREILSQAKGYCSGDSESELGEALHKHLASRRYLVIMDDMWDVKAWCFDDFCSYFPSLLFNL